MRAEAELQKFESEEKYNEKDPKMSDNKNAHYESMKKDMRKLIEFKNELENLVEQQNSEVERKGEELKVLSNELDQKDQEIAQMSEYITSLERHNQATSLKPSKSPGKGKKNKGKMIEMTKKIRDQQEEIDMLKSMVSGGKKELKTKVHNIQMLKKKLHNLEKINKLHLAKHSDVQSIISGRHERGKDPFSKYEDLNSVNDKYAYSDNNNAIGEVRPDLEETGKYSIHKTAHFGQTIDPKKDTKISSQNIGKNASMKEKTPRYGLLKETKSSKYFKSTHPNKNRGSVQRSSVEGLEGIPTVAITNPFDSRVEQGYDQYCINMASPGYKNNSYGMSHVLSSSNSAVELPSIRKRNF